MSLSSGPPKSFVVVPTNSSFTTVHSNFVEVRKLRSDAVGYRKSTLIELLVSVKRGTRFIGSFGFVIVSL